MSMERMHTAWVLAGCVLTRLQVLNSAAASKGLPKASMVDVFNSPSRAGMEWISTRTTARYPS